MTNEKISYTWDDRAIHVSHGKKHRIYFFRKSFDGCNQKNLKSLMLGITEAFESKYGVAYSSELTEAIAKGTLDVVRDPLLNSLFGGKPIDMRAILEFYENNAVSEKSDGMAFVDLCILLGELDRAMSFARKVGKEYDLLKQVKESNGKLLSEVLKSQNMRMWLEYAPQNLDVCRLTSLIYRAASETSTSEHALIPLTELWGEGYYWDAFCLISMLYPTSGFLPFMKQNIPRLVNDNNCCVLERVLKSLHDANNETKDMQGTILDDCLLPHLDPLIVYRLVKLDIARNEKTSGELEKLTIRTKCSQNLRRALLLCLVHGRPLQTKAMAADAVESIKSFGGAALGDYFPVAERMLFLGCINMLCDLVSAVTYAATPGYQTTLNLDNSAEKGITNVLFDHWRATTAEIWCDKFGRDTFHHVCTSLLAYHVKELEKVYKEAESYHIHAQRLRYLKLSLKLGWLFTSDDFDCEREVFKGIISLAEDSDLKGQAVQLAEKFAYKLTAESKTSTIAPVHITGDQLISSIKKQNVPIPPLPKEVVPVTVERSAPPAPQEPVKIEVVPQEVAQPPIIPSSLFHPNAQTHQLPGQPLNILSDEGVNMAGMIDEMETKWEAPVPQNPAEQSIQEQAVNTTMESVAGSEKNVSQGVSMPEQIVNRTMSNVAAQKETRQAAPVEEPVVLPTEVPAPRAVEVPAPPQPINEAKPPVASSSCSRPVSKRTEYSDDGWGDSPATSPVKPAAPPAKPKSDELTYEERVKLMMENANKCVQENYATKAAQEPVASPPAAPEPVVAVASPVAPPQHVQEVPVAASANASSLTALDALLGTTKTAAGDAQSMVEKKEEPKIDVSKPVLAEAVSTESNDSVPTSAAEMANAPVVLPPTPAAQTAAPVATPPSPASKPSTPYKTGGFEAMLASGGEGSFGSFGGGSMGGGRGGHSGGFGGQQGGGGYQSNGRGGFQGGALRGGYNNGVGFNGAPRGGYRGRGDGGRGRGGFGH